MNNKQIILLAIFLILSIIIISLFIMFYNTDKELKPYLKDKNLTFLENSI